MSLNIRNAVDKLLLKEDVTLLQIGAHTGSDANDPLNKSFNNYNKMLNPNHKLQAILCEPVQRFFRDLVINYDRFKHFVTLENVAISDSIGLREFYVISQEAERNRAKLPAWISQLGSLKKNRITDLWDNYEKDKSIQEYLSKNTVCEYVITMSIEDVMKRNHISNIDVLQIDAEGYDFEIIKTINFEKIRPKIINYEYVLLGEYHETAIDLLNHQGYETKLVGQDVFALRKDYHALEE